MERQSEFDIAKGIAIYLVVLGHLLGQIAKKNIMLITFCHMPVFFWVSGFFLNKSMKTSGRQIVVRKLKRLLVPYIFWSMVSFAANVAMKWIHGKLLIVDIIDEFVDIVIYSRSVWFLIIILISELLCIATWSIARRYKCNKYVLLFIVWFAIAIIPICELFRIYKFKWLFPFLILGMLCEEYDVYNKLNNKFGLAGLLFLAGSYFLYDAEYFEDYISFSYCSVYSILIGILYYVLSIFSICLILCLAIWINKAFHGRGNYVATVGRYSLEVYVMHMLFVKFMLIVPSFIMDSDIYTYTYFMLYSAVITILIVVLCRHMLEKNKLFLMTVGKIN